MIAVTALSELTIDGKLSLRAGASSKNLFDFYGSELKEWTHGQRAESDAIMVGANTVRIDDPDLTVRYVNGPSPLRIVPCSNGALPLHVRILSDGLPTLIVVSRSAAPGAVSALRDKQNVEVIACGDERVDLVELMTALDERGIRHLIVEGGARLLHSMLEADLVSRIIIKHIPVIAGDTDAPCYLQRPDGRSRLAVSRWRIERAFVMSGVSVSVYRSSGMSA